MPGCICVHRPASALEIPCCAGFLARLASRKYFLCMPLCSWYVPNTHPVDHHTMNPPPTQTAPLALDPLTHAAMLCTTMDALPFHPRATADQKAAMREAARLAIARLRPRDPLEAMLAARIVAFHAHLMDNLRSAAQPDLPPNLQLRFQGRAMALSRVMDATVFK